jgi:hypothetical protein
VPDFTADLLRWTDDGEWTWTEWRWSGTHTDGAPFAMAGVIVFRIVDGAIGAGRLYMEPVRTQDEGIDDSNRALFRPPTS